MGPGAPNASQKLMSPGSLMPARAPRRSAWTRHCWRPPVASSPPRRSAAAAPQPLSQAVRGESLGGRLLRPTLVLPIVAGLVDPRALLLGYLRSDPARL